MTATCPSASVCPRSSAEKAAEPVEALPITTIVADSVEAVECVRPGWNRWRSGYSLATSNADPDRHLATPRGLGGHARPYVAMLHGGANPHPLIVGRKQVRFGRNRAPLLRSLDIVNGGLITDGSQPAVHAVVDHLRHSIDAGRSVADAPDPHWRFALVSGSYEWMIRRYARKHRYNMRCADRLLVDRLRGDVALRRFEKPTRIEELAAGAAQITVCNYQAALGAGAVNTTVHRFAAGLDRLVSDVAVGCGVLTRVRKRWRGRLAERRKSPTAGRGLE